MLFSTASTVRLDSLSKLDHLGLSLSFSLLLALTTRGVTGSTVVFSVFQTGVDKLVRRLATLMGSRVPATVDGQDADILRALYNKRKCMLVWFTWLFMPLLAV